MASLDPVSCKYAYTEEEYMTVRLLRRRLRQPGIYIAFLLVFDVALLAGVVIPSPSGPLPLPMAVCFVIAAIFLPTFACYMRLPVRSFIPMGPYRKDKLRGCTMTLTLSADGIASSINDDSEQVEWQTFGRTVETPEGFALVYRVIGYSFAWLPKKGFADENSIAQARELVRTHIPKYGELLK